MRAPKFQMRSGEDAAMAGLRGVTGRSFGYLSQGENTAFFLLTVLGFTFWYLLAVPFASHRESYWWLGMVSSQPFSTAFSMIASTYRPLAQVVSWTAFLILDPSIFPTSVVRQLCLQGLVYSFFLLGWWLIYSAANERRVLALTSLVAGGVFFSGYVHLFHVYGLSYVPVILMLGCLLLAHATARFERLQTRFAAIAILLSFWHPFATGLFAGYYFGYYLKNASQGNAKDHARSIIILLTCVALVASLVLLFAPNFTKAMDSSDRLAGFFVSFRTNEINAIASTVALGLAVACALTLPVGPRMKIVWGVGTFALGSILAWASIPVLFLWLGVSLLKLILRADWPLFFLALAAAMLPFGGGIGTPMYSLFAIVMAVYITAMDTATVDQTLAFLKPQYVGVLVAALLLVIVMVRLGMNITVLSRVARPLLVERERTYQLEDGLAWLRKSEYCGCEIAFVGQSGNPVDSVENAISRQNRAPAWISDVRVFWDSVLRCRDRDPSRVAVMTFGGPELSGATEVLKIEGRYAGEFRIWIKNGNE